MEIEGRRKFLGVCLAGASVVAVGAAVYPVFRFLAPISRGPGIDKLTFAETDLPEGEAKFIEYAGSAAVLVKIKTGETVALSAVCTHLGCIVQWLKNSQTFLCPCHAGEFAADGTVLAGPPPKPLAKIPVTVSEGKITVG